MDNLSHSIALPVWNICICLHGRGFPVKQILSLFENR